MVSGLLGDREIGKYCYLVKIRILACRWLLILTNIDLKYTDKDKIRPQTATMS